jgi:hypothetical protein
MARTKPLFNGIYMSVMELTFVSMEYVSEG